MYYHIYGDGTCLGRYAAPMDSSTVLSPSYLRRPESYDRLGVPAGNKPQRFIANRLLVAAGTNTAAGKYTELL